MPNDVVYMDNQATTRADPRVVEVMVDALQVHYGNPGSVTHAWGQSARDRVEAARQSIAAMLGATPRELIFTSGATESNNLAIRGVAEAPRRRGRHMVSVATEHRAVLDPLHKLAERGFEITLLPVACQSRPDAGRIDPDQVAAALRNDTILVSVMLANNEMGALQPVADIADICRQRGVLLHCDASQAVGKIPVDLNQLGVDLLSFSAHKFYGPPGMGGLIMRRRSPPIRLVAQIDGGGQQFGLRSGTLNLPGILGMAKALELCGDEMEAERARLGQLRDRLAAGLTQQIPEVQLNGPALQDSWRLPGNLNLLFPGVEGGSLMLQLPRLAVSSGSACSSADPQPSHVLQALGRSLEQARSSLRFGLGRFNSAAEVDFVIDYVAEGYRRLRAMVL